MPTHHHSHALKEAIIAHWQNGLPYSKIVKKINDSGIAKINKSSVWYQINKFKETNSTKNKPRSGRPRTVRTPESYHSTGMKIQRNHKRSIFGLHPRQTWIGFCHMGNIGKKSISKTSQEFGQPQAWPRHSLG